MQKNLFIIFAIIIVECLLINCNSARIYSPIIQERNDIETFKQVGKVYFERYQYKGVFRVILLDEIKSQDVLAIAKELTEKYDCSLVKPAFPEVKNPDIESKLIYIKDASDETIMEMSKDERIKFIASYYTSH